jgi:hypothetical protein
MNPKPHEVRAFWKHMSDHFRSSIVRKSDATEMSFVGHFLGIIGVLSKDEFLRNFTTTIGRKIYVPFEVGDEDSDDLWAQVKTCVHEHQHIVQSLNEPITYATNYLLDKSARARYEAEAYSTALEMDRWRFGRSEDPASYAVPLRHYGLGEEHIGVAIKSMKISALAIASGAVVTKASRVATRWMNVNVPHWKETA